MSEDRATIKLNNMPDGHLVVGYIAMIKMLDAKGNLYWSLRMLDLNDMEAYGLVMDAANSISRDLQSGKNIVDD